MSLDETSIVQEKIQDSKKQHVLIGSLILIVLGVSALCAFLYLSNRKLTNQITETNNTINTAPTNKIVETVPESESSQTSPISNDPNDPFTTYTNNKLGFSIEVPKMAANLYGNCTWVDAGNKSSFRPKTEITPVKVFENGDSTYIAFEYAYQLTDQTTIDGQSYFKGCKKVDTTIAQLDQERRTWNIISKQVNNDAELDAFIKQRFGSGCSLGEKVASNQPNVFSIKVLDDGKDMEFSKCVLNFMFVIKYAPSLNRVFTYDRGQSFTFAKTLDYSVVYDDDMDKSFRVIL